ncbi:MAG TPA: hypothetical protein VGK99_09650 [Acidobacteriota bacterium]|jgi:hypothetical protein
MKKVHIAVFTLVLVIFAVGCGQKATTQSAAAPLVSQEHQTIPVWFADGSQGQLIVPVNRSQSLVGDTVAVDRTGYAPVGFETPMVRPRVYDQGSANVPVVQRTVYRTTPRYSSAPYRAASRGAYASTAEDRTYRQKRSLKKSAIIVGGSAAGGAVIGAVAGGKKGAVVGGLSGAGAGLVYDLLTRNKQR